MKRPPGSFAMLIVGESIVIISRRWRSKWYRIHCVCSKWKRRKDGTCKHERTVLASLRPDVKPRARIEKARATDDK